MVELIKIINIIHYDKHLASKQTTGQI